MDVIADPRLVGTMLALQGLGSLFLVVFTFAFRRVMRDLDENTKATGKIAESMKDLNLFITREYASKNDLDKLERQLKEEAEKVERVHVAEMSELRRKYEMQLVELTILQTKIGHDRRSGAN